MDFDVQVPSYREYCRKHIFTFPVIDGLPDVDFDISGIHPLKQREVIKLKSIVDKYDFIIGAWIIGSSCNPMCTKFSDTDMVIETTITPNVKTKKLVDAETELHLATESGLDLLCLENMSITEPVSYEIYWRVKIK